MKSQMRILPCPTLLLIATHALLLEDVIFVFLHQRKIVIAQFSSPDREVLAGHLPTSVLFSTFFRFRVRLSLNIAKLARSISIRNAPLKLRMLLLLFHHRISWSARHSRWLFLNLAALSNSQLHDIFNDRLEGSRLISGVIFRRVLSSQRFDCKCACFSCWPHRHFYDILAKHDG